MPLILFCGLIVTMSVPMGCQHLHFHCNCFRHFCTKRKGLSGTRGALPNENAAMFGLTFGVAHHAHVMRYACCVRGYGVFWERLATSVGFEAELVQAN